MEPQVAARDTPLRVDLSQEMERLRARVYRAL